MFTKFFLQKLMLLIFVVLSFSSQSLNAQDEDGTLAYMGATYASGGAIGLNIFYTDESGLYTSISAALPAERLYDNGVMSGPDYSMDELIGQHIGFIFADYYPLTIGLGFVWGGSYYKDKITNGASVDVAFVRAGVEIPILYSPIKEIPIMILPFLEAMVNTDDKEDWGNQRYGVNVFAHIKFLSPLIFQFESGIYKSSISNIDDRILESGVGFNWRIGVGFGL